MVGDAGTYDSSSDDYYFSGLHNFSVQVLRRTEHFSLAANAGNGDVVNGGSRGKNRHGLDGRGARPHMGLPGT